MNHSHHLRGIIYVLAGFTFWVVADAFMKLAAEAHLAPHEIVGVSGAVGVIMMLGKTIHGGWRKTMHHLLPENFKLQAALGLIALLVNYANVIALRHLPFTIFYIAVFTAPMMIAILSAVFLKEQLTWLKFLLVVIGFGGVVIAIDPFSKNMSGGDLIGFSAAFASSVCFAFNVIITRAVMRSAKPESIIFSNGLIQVVVSLLVAFIAKSHADWSLYIAYILIGCGILTVMGNFCSTLSLKYAPANTVAPFHYSQIITGSLVAFLVWHETPGLMFWLGAAIIVGTGIYIARTAHAPRSPEIAPH